MATLGAKKSRSTQGGADPGVGPVHDGPVRRQEHVVRPQIQMEQRLPGRRGGGFGLERAEPVEVTERPAVEPRRTLLLQLPPVDPGDDGPIVRALNGRLRQRREGEKPGQGREGVEHPIQLAGPPGLGGGAPVDVLQSQDDPAMLPLVVGPEKPRGGDIRWQRGCYFGLPAVGGGGVRVGFRADGLDEDAAAIHGP